MIWDHHSVSHVGGVKAWANPPGPMRTLHIFFAFWHWDLYSILASARPRMSPYVFYLPQSIKSPNNIIIITSKNLLCARHCFKSFISSRLLFTSSLYQVVTLKSCDNVSRSYLYYSYFLCLGVLPKIQNTYLKKHKKYFIIPTQVFRESQDTLAWKSWEVL